MNVMNYLLDRSLVSLSWNLFIVDDLISGKQNEPTNSKVKKHWIFIQNIMCSPNTLFGLVSIFFFSIIIDLQTFSETSLVITSVFPWQYSKFPNICPYHNSWNSYSDYCRDYLFKNLQELLQLHFKHPSEISVFLFFSG